MSTNQCDTLRKEHITTDAFAALGFTQVNAWLWTCRELNFRIEHFGDFSGTFFSMLKPYYLFHLSGIFTPFSGKEIAAGDVADIVNAVQQIINEQAN